MPSSSPSPGPSPPAPATLRTVPRQQLRPRVEGVDVVQDQFALGQDRAVVQFSVGARPTGFSTNTPILANRGVHASARPWSPGHPGRFSAALSAPTFEGRSGGIQEVDRCVPDRVDCRGRTCTAAVSRPKARAAVHATRRQKRQDITAETTSRSRDLRCAGRDAGHAIRPGEPSAVLALCRWATACRLPRTRR